MCKEVLAMDLVDVLYVMYTLFPVAMKIFCMLANSDIAL